MVFFIYNLKFIYFLYIYRLYFMGFNRPIKKCYIYKSVETQLVIKVKTTVYSVAYILFFLIHYNLLLTTSLHFL